MLHLSTMSRILLLLCLCTTWAAAGAEGGFLFVTFKGEATPQTEQIYFALSRDGRKWEALNKAEPVLVSKLGEKGVRDPYLLRSHDGQRFYLLATDLSIHLKNDWHRATHAGSRSIVIWDSTNLVQWSEPRLVQVAHTNAGCTWAPEAVYDEDAGDYLVFWASTTRDDDYKKQRIWACRTKDFHTFGPPFVYIDKPTQVIDTTIARSGTNYYRFTKDEQFKAITLEYSPGLMSGWSTVSNFSLAKMTGYEGPACFVLDRRENGEPATWCLLLDYYSKGQGYKPFLSQDLGGGQFSPGPDFEFPFRLRHGSVLPISESEYVRLQEAYTTAATAPPPALPGLNADPHIAVFGETFYLYPTSDGFPGWSSKSFQAWSSRDLVSWKNEGEILNLPRDLTWAKEHAWAPAMATKDGKYYFYFSAGQNIGVAVADSPVGPFKDPIGKPLVAKTDFEKMQAIDPMVFVDQDGAAYLYWGQGRCKAVKLNPDMVSFDKAEVRDITPPGYNEGPFLHVRQGKYYLSWSEYDTRDPRYSVAYGTSESPLGPFTKGPENPILRQAGAVKGAGHHSIVKIPGTDEWVIAYHRFRIPDGDGFHRESCLSPMRYDKEGRILPVKVTEGITRK
jgi:beta-xylosidase